MPKKGGKRKKSRTHLIQAIPSGAKVSNDSEQADEWNAPRSIVARASKVSPYISELIKDLRRLMGPFTADNLKEKSYNRMKDYSSVAGQLGVTHILVISQTEANIILRIARIPDGPTLHFKIDRYSLCRQVRLTQKHPYESPSSYKSPPLVVLNNFSQLQHESYVKLMRVTFQHMFPTINIKTVHLHDCRRVVLFHLNEDGVVEMRHYAIRANPVGVSRPVKRIIQTKIPNLGSLEDISEFIDGAMGVSSVMSDSEAEDDASKVILPDHFVGKGNIKSQLSAMKLTELGPRMTLDLFKVEQGVNEGDILYHKFVHKSAEEAAKTKSKIEKLKKTKEERRTTQEKNVKRKQDAIDEKRQARMEKKRKRLEPNTLIGGDDNDSGGGGGIDDDDDDDADDERSHADDDDDDDNNNNY